MERPRLDSHRMLVGALHTIATRTWTPPAGAEREARLAELRERAAGNVDALTEAAGILLGIRPDDEHDPRHARATAGAAMLLELAGVTEDDERVREAKRVGEERRERGRLRPGRSGGW
jgi:hypothetical protein